MIIDTIDSVVQNNSSPGREIWISIATMLKTCSSKCAITVVALRFIHTADFGIYHPIKLSQLFEHAWPATFLPELIGYKPGYTSLFIRNQGESLSIRVCGTFHHPFVATQGRPG